VALVELARAFLHAHGNPSSLTQERLAQLAPLFEVLLDQSEPLATQDVRALLTYVLRAFGDGSPVRELVESAIHGRSRTMFISIADSLVAKGKAEGLVRAVLGVLEHRSVTIPKVARERISSAHDEQLLQRWFDRAFTATSVEDLFELDG
jgi:hypothetical protein